MRKEICHEQEMLLLFDGKALCATGAIVGFQNLKHILLMVRATHGLPTAINCDWAGTLELTNQPNRVIFMVVKSNKAGHTLQHFRTKGVNIPFPRLGQHTKSVGVDALAVLPIFAKCRGDAGDSPLCMALGKAQFKASPLGGTLESDGFRVAAIDFSAHFCTCCERGRNTRLLCKEKGLLLLRQTGVHLADDVEIRIVVQQLAGSDGVLTIKDIVSTAEMIAIAYVQAG